MHHLERALTASVPVLAKKARWRPLISTNRFASGP